MNREEAIKKVAISLFNTIYPSFTHHTSWYHLPKEKEEEWLKTINFWLKENPELAIVDREAKLPAEYKTVTEDKYDWEGNWTESIKVQVPKSVKEILAEGYVKELK